MPLFIPPPPSPFMLFSDNSISGGNAAITAGAAFYLGVILNSVTTFSAMRTGILATPTGNVDMGIYDATGTNDAPNNLLGHTGAIAATAGTFTKNLLVNTTLVPGRYWLALLDTVADSFEFIAPAEGTGALGIGPYYRSSATTLTVLPATAGTVTQVANIYAVQALRLNGYV